MGGGVERQFSRSGRIVTPLYHRLNPETIHDIIMYKNNLAILKRQEELDLWENTGAMVVEEERKIEEEPPYLRSGKISDGKIGREMS